MSGAGIKGSAALLCALLSGTTALGQGFDTVILNGRVMDPETGFDQVANVGINNGFITEITDAAITGEREIDATGHVVAPGFIDGHSHAQDPFGHRLYLRDGVTTAMDLELGAYPVSDYYAFWEGKAQINHGVSVGHPWARMYVLDGIDSEGRGFYNTSLADSLNDGAKWQTKTFDPLDLPRVNEAVETGLKEGGLGIGFPIGYYTAVGSPEVMETAALARRYDAFITSHARYLAQIPPSGFLGMQEMINVAQMQDVPLLLHHIPSNCLGLTTACLDLIDEARAKGIRVVGEFYPYTFASTYAKADYLRPGYQQQLGITGEDLVVIETGETLDDEKFDKLRDDAPGTYLLMYSMKEEDMRAALKRPGILFGSDGMPFFNADGSSPGIDAAYGEGRGHPRGAGAHARFLRIVREDQPITLMQALSKLSYELADFLGHSVPQFRLRGRLQEGMIADITIFDPETVTDNSSWETGRNTLPSTGIPYVLVNGVVVVDGSEVQKDLFPGVPIRRPIKQD